MVERQATEAEEGAGRGFQEEGEVREERQAEMEVGAAQVQRGWMKRPCLTALPPGLELSVKSAPH